MSRSISGRASREGLQAGRRAGHSRFVLLGCALRITMGAGCTRFGFGSRLAPGDPDGPAETQGPSDGAFDGPRRADGASASAPDLLRDWVGQRSGDFAADAIEHDGRADGASSDGRPDSALDSLSEGQAGAEGQTGLQLLFTVQTSSLEPELFTAVVGKTG